MERIHGVHSVLLLLKKSLFCLMPIRICELPLFFLEKSAKIFLQFDFQKNFIEHIENLPQHLLEKYIGDNLSITILL